MRRRVIGFVLAGVLLAGSTGVGQKKQQEIDLQAAIRTETVHGDLKAAIKQYGGIVARYKDDRAVAATALIRMAECYRKQGDVESRKIYERVLRDYPDQKEAVSVARARLGRDGSAQRAGAMSSRQVWTTPPLSTIYGTVSHDGRYLPYTDWKVPGGNGELFLHDITAGTDRQITHEVEKFVQQYASDATFSSDDTQLAYAWFNKDRHELRVIALRDAGPSAPRVLFSNPEVPKIFPGDWSADGKWLAVRLVRKDKTAQIGLVAVDDGSLRVLKTVGGSSKLFFSPDGKYLAYDLPTRDTGNQRDVYVLAIDGSREIPAVVHSGNDVLMGWSPDGKRLLFTSDRTGSTGLWAVTFVDGNPQGAPEQIKIDVTGSSMGLTNRGTLYSRVHHSSFFNVRSDIRVAAFDFVEGQFLSTPVLAVEAFVGANSFPAWSPDGKYLAFLSRRDREKTAIMILSHDTGQLRELQSPLDALVGGGGSVMRWSPDGLSLAIQAQDASGRYGIFRIDATTGEAAPIALRSLGPLGEGEYLMSPAWAPDGKKIYYSGYDDSGLTAVFERDLSSGNEREVIRGGGREAFWDLSPDGKYLVGAVWDFFATPPALPPRTGKWSVLLAPASGGEPRELMHGESQGAGVLMWAPDSRSIFVYSIKDRPTGYREVWRIAIDGTEPQKLALDVHFLGPLGSSYQQLHPHPDGRRVAFAATEATKPDEVWALENFLPPLDKGK